LLHFSNFPFSFVLSFPFCSLSLILALSLPFLS
jgi:hypothetical protein